MNHTKSASGIPSYSFGRCWNTLPFPDPSANDKATLGDCGQAILDCQDANRDVPLVDLYSPTRMPSEFRVLLEAADAAVDTVMFGASMGDADKLPAMLELYRNFTLGNEPEARTGV